MGLTAGNAAGYRGGVINTGIEAILVLPAVPVVPFLPGPALRDGFSVTCSGSSDRCSRGVAASFLPAVAAAANQVLSRRCGVSYGQLLRQRQSLSDVAASLMASLLRQRQSHHVQTLRRH